MRIIRHFEKRFSVIILQVHVLSRPPGGPAVSLMWSLQYYSLQPSKWKKKHSTDIATTVTYNTVRSLRSAASFFLKLDLMTAFPGKVITDNAERPVVTMGCLATDELPFTLMSNGMARRLGTESRPSIALQAVHVRWLNDSLELRYWQTSVPTLRLELARAALANIVAWLGWLRAQELFGLRWCVVLTSPQDGPTMDLPDHVGVIEYRLLEQTKSDRTRAADCVTAYCTGSGLSPGLWIERLVDLLRLVPGDQTVCEAPLFVHVDESPWTSHYFRSTYLIPSLQEQRLSGDPTLRAFNGSPGNTLAEKFWSMHSYRRGGRSRVSRRRLDCVRKPLAVKSLNTVSGM